MPQENKNGKGGLLDAFGVRIGKATHTATYKPQQAEQFFNRPRDLPVFDFFSIHMMMYDPTIRLGLAMRKAPIMSAQLAYLEDDGQTWTPGVKADDPKVGQFVEGQIKKIWRSSVDRMLDSQIWGWGGGEVDYHLVNDRWEFLEYHDRHSRDVYPIVKTKGSSRGSLVGVEIASTEEDKNPKLGIPGNAFYTKFGARDGRWFGHSVLYGAYSAWCDKWLHGGALDVRRLFMHADAYGGRKIGYPPGMTEIDGMEDMANRDIAREMVEQYAAGNVMTYPLSYDEGGRPTWKIDEAVVTSNPAHILEFPKALDFEMTRGLEIPDDVIMSEVGSGAWAGKKVPMLAFYGGLNTWAFTILDDINTQMIEWMVAANFGEEQSYEVGLKPMDVQVSEQQGDGQQQQLGAQGQGFDPSQAGGGQDDMFGGFGGMEMGDEGLPGSPADAPQMMSIEGEVGKGLVQVSDLIAAAKHAIGEKVDRGGTVIDSTVPNNLSSVMAVLPAQAADLVDKLAQRIDQRDFLDREEEPHVTAKWGIHEVSGEQVSHVLRNDAPFEVTFGVTSYFCGPENDIVYVSVDSDALHDIHARISDSVPHTETHPEYTPHVTIAKVKSGTGARYEGMHDMAGSVMLVNELLFSDPERRRKSLPLEGTFGAARMGWERYDGPRGGRGWKNEAGDIAYQEDRPGDRSAVADPAKERRERKKLPKGEWVAIETGTPEFEHYRQQLYDLVSTAYESIGGHIKIKSPSDLDRYRYWLVSDMDEDPEIDVAIFGKGEFGIKGGGAGHDGTKDAISAYKNMATSIRKGEKEAESHWWGEVSGKLSYALLKRGVPAIEDEATVAKLLAGDKYVWHGDHPDPEAPPLFKKYKGWYEKDFGPGGKHVKIITGIPNLSKEQDSVALSWERYDGPRGGRGWKNEAGDIAYQEDRPGDGDDPGQPEFQLRNKPSRRKIKSRGKERQESLFAKAGEPGQMNLFDDAGVPDDLVAARGGRGIVADDKASDLGQGLWHGGAAGSMGKIVLFVEGEPDDSFWRGNSTEGHSLYQLDESEARSVNDEMVDFAAEFFDVPKGEARELLQPPNIVSGAGAWDDEQFVSELFQRFEDDFLDNGMVFKTPDGAISFPGGDNIIRRTEPRTEKSTYEDLPEGFLDKWNTTWQDAGFIAPGGELIGREGHHRKLLKELGSTGIPGHDGNTPEIASRYGLIRTTEFYEWQDAVGGRRRPHLNVEVFGAPTIAQLKVLSDKASESESVAVEVTGSSGKMLDYKKWTGRTPGRGHLSSFIDKSLRSSTSDDAPDKRMALDEQLPALIQRFSLTPIETAQITAEFLDS